MQNKRIKHGFNSKRRRDLLFYSLVLAVPVIQYCIFYIGVNFNSILMAFQNIDVVGNTSPAGFSNFAKVFTDLFSEPKLISAAGNSFLAYAVSLVVGIPLALLFSFYIAKKRFAHKIFSVFLFLPSIFPVLSMAIIFKSTLDKSLVGILDGMGISVSHFIGGQGGSDISYATVLFYTIWISFGSNVLLYVGAMNGINESVVEAAELDGATGFREFIYITVPLIFPTIITFITIGIAGIFTNQLNLFSFYSTTAADKDMTYGYFLYQETVLRGDMGYPYLAAMGFVFTLVTAPLVFGVKYLLEKFGPSVG